MSVGRGKGVCKLEVAFCDLKNVSDYAAGRSPILATG